MTKDQYSSLAEPSEGLFKAKGTKFLSFAFPVSSVEEVAERLSEVRALHHKARHHCYAYRLGAKGADYRANDDGEPNHSAGDPILGQLLSAEVSDVLIIVVRYFGGTKLGVGGLITAYRAAAAAALDAGRRVTLIETRKLTISTDYTRLATLMEALKSGAWNVASPLLDETGATLVVTLPTSQFEQEYAALYRALAGLYPGEEDVTQALPGYRMRVE